MAAFGKIEMRQNARIHAAFEPLVAFFMCDSQPLSCPVHPRHLLFAGTRGAPLKSMPLCCAQDDKFGAPLPEARKLGRNHLPNIRIYAVTDVGLDETSPTYRAWARGIAVWPVIDHLRNIKR